MPVAAKVPAPFAPPFDAAEQFVAGLFNKLERKPEAGTVHVGGERYVLMRAESFYLAWSEALEASFGPEATRDLLYNTARAIGRADCKAFCERLGVTDGIARLASGPLHFAHAGWAFVDIHGDSTPAVDDNYFLHYDHPNTFESEVLASRKRTSTAPACVFSAGYSAGWCSEAFGIEVHAREIRCCACGGGRCEFIMAPASKLDEHERRMLKSE
jgi:predicted hydrocarbon binding protein